MIFWSSLTFSNEAMMIETRKLMIMMFMKKVVKNQMNQRRKTLVDCWNYSDSKWSW